MSRAYGVNGLNQYSSTTNSGVPAASFTYDANGNLSSDGSTTYVYDAVNRLVSASGVNNATLSYDPMGRLWQVSQPAPGKTTRFLYDGDHVFEEIDGAGNVVDTYIFGPGADELLAWWELSGGTWLRRQAYADHQGSIVAVTDGQGNKVQINGYDAWGVPNALNVGRFQYTGQMYIPELGFYYYKARMYSSRLGRFLQIDPIGYQDQVNLYAYVNNDPLNGTDSKGTDNDCTGSRIGCGGGIAPGRSGGTLDGFSAAQQASKPTTTVVGIRDINSPDGKLIGRMLKDRDVVAAINRAWRAAHGDRGSAEEKNEYGFWVTLLKGGDFIVGPMIAGDGPNIDGARIAEAHDATPQARIFVHVHPFRIGERGVTSIGISGLERGHYDVGIALNYKSLVVSLARPEPYTGRGVYVDWADYFWGRDRR